MKLFFKRPIEMLNLIKNIFRTILTDEETRLPVRDYAAMLYRGLENDPESLRKTFLSQREFNDHIHKGMPEL